MITENEYGEDPQGRRRFFGIYSASVVAINDPLNRNRIKVSVFMPTGGEVHNWAKACLPITSNSYHPDHAPHTAQQIADLLTTSSIGLATGGPNTGTAHNHIVTITPLTVSPINVLKQLNHPHTPVHAKVGTVNSSIDSRANKIESAYPSAAIETDSSAYTAASGISAPGTTIYVAPSANVPEHTLHRNIPALKQLVWVMFEAGDPEFPVWIGVQS